MSLKGTPKIELEEDHYEFKSNLHGMEESEFALR